MRILKRIPFPWLISVCAILLMGLLSPFLLSGMVKWSVSDHMTEIDAVEEPYDVILVLGCGIKKDGRPSDMLEDRLKTGIEAYFAGVAPMLLLSGDNEHEDYNELAVMKEYCMAAGVPEEDILCDRYGLSTYDSVVRAATLFEIKRAAIITQEYHLYRALYIAEKTGIDAIGIDADIRIYRLQWYRDLREILARCKDFYITQCDTLPAYTTRN